MPQLDKSTWFITITSMLLWLFILMQLKFIKCSSFTPSHPTAMENTKTSNPL